MAPGNQNSHADIFLGPGHYRIKVLGSLDFSWSDRLGGLTIKSVGGEGVREETTLEGVLPDQAALAGVMNALYELQLAVLSVERLANEGPESSA